MEREDRGGDAGESILSPGPGFGKRSLQASPQLYSFLLFSALSVFAIALFPRFYLYFVSAIMVDGVATIIGSDTIVRADRSALSLALIILSVTLGSYNLFFLFLEVVILVAVLDTSFLLRRLEGTTVDFSVLGARFRSYGYTLVPALLLSWSLTYLYSLEVSLFSLDPQVALAASSAAALFVIYAVSRYLSQPPRDGR